MNDLANYIRLALRECVDHHGFGLPLIVTAVAVNGAVQSVRTDGVKVEILAAGIVDLDFALPINIMVTDAHGEAARLLISANGRMRMVN